MISSIHNLAYTTAKNAAGWYAYPIDLVLASGGDRLDLLHRMTTNAMSNLQGSDTEGNGVRNIFLTDKARILDVFTALARANDLLLVCSHGLGDKICSWLDKYTFIEDFSAQNTSERYRSALVFGPRSPEALALLSNQSENDIRHLQQYSWKQVSINGVAVILIRYQMLSKYCFLLLYSSDNDGAMLGALHALSGDIAEIDDNTFEVLRIEATWGKHGREWTEERNPLEAGLVDLVDFKKGCYIGQEVIARLDTYNKVKMRLSGFTSSEPIPLQARFWEEQDGRHAEIGNITSVAYSPELGSWIALGYLRSHAAQQGSRIEAVWHEEGVERRCELTIVAIPFIL